VSLLCGSLLLLCWQLAAAPHLGCDVLPFRSTASCPSFEAQLRLDLNCNQSNELMFSDLFAIRTFAIQLSCGDLSVRASLLKLGCSPMSNNAAAASATAAAFTRNPPTSNLSRKEVWQTHNISNDESSNR
jgi:hypothetical protein